MPFAWAKIFHCANAPCHAAALARDDRERRAVVDHEHRLDRRGRVLVAELDQRIDVAEAHVVGAGGNTGDRLQRAGRGIDGDVESLSLVVALVEPDQERCRRALELEVEAEFDRCLRRGRSGGQREGDDRDGTGHVRRAGSEAEKVEEAHR
jgi:hypothetical protein